MQIFFLKSLLSILVVLSALLAMYTMFGVFGKTEKGRDAERLKRVHRANGVFFIILYAVIAYFCLEYLLETKAEPSPRASLHGLLAVSVIVLLALKIVYVRFYRAYYNQAKVLGLVVALLALGMAATSGGYYLLVTEFGAEPLVKEAPPLEEAALPAGEFEIRTDSESIEEGRELYMSKCTFCHDPYSEETIVGPGHKGILQNPTLPVSHRPATPENVVRQLREPFRKMPSFSYLKDEEIADILAFLNTL